MQKHIPVLLKEVLQTVESLDSAKESLNIIDCTLGQAGHSFEIFKKFKKGVLISIDLDVNSIDWVISSLSGELTITNEQIENRNVYRLQSADSRLQPKVWYILEADFADIDQVGKLFNISKFDLILADLGFSNYQLNQNLGISYDRPGQRLDMRYNAQSSVISDQRKPLRITEGTDRSSLLAESSTAADILNHSDKNELVDILRSLGQIEEPKYVVDEIAAKRNVRPFMYVRDLLSILNKNKFPKNYRTKVFQALRAYVNKEMERLNAFLDIVLQMLAENGELLVISFNSLEENLITTKIPQVQIKEPNITEIISNSQSRSAKLYIYKNKESNTD
jgi:16S rRNA (cytosine1402-N4)-methyltransferase